MNKNRVQSILALATCLLLFSLKSVNSQNSNTTFERITSKDGFPQSAVNYIIQDKKGFMWFATYDGLIKYDGYTFKVYRNIVGDKNSLSNNGLTALYEDRDGYIWVTNNANTGLDKFDPVNESVTRFMNDPNDSTSISSNNIYQVMQDKEGNVWICSVNALNLAVNEKRGDTTFTRFKRFYNTSDTPYGNIYEDRNGRLLLFSKYLYFFDKKHNKLTRSIKLNDQFLKQSITEDKSGNLWLGTYMSGMAKLAYNKQTQSFENTIINEINVTPRNKNYVIIDDKERVWIATQTKGLFQYNIQEDRLVNFLNDKTDITSISDNNINCLYIDRSGTLWIGTYSQGLCKIDLYKKDFFHYKSKVGDMNSLSGNAITSIHSTKPGELWVALDAGGGISRLVFDQDKVKQVIHYKNNPHDNNTIPSNNVFCLVQRKNGEVWTGSMNGFISKILPEYPGSNKQPIIKTYKLVQWTFSIYEDRQGTLWGGAWHGGLWRHDDKTEKFISYLNDPANPSSLCDNVIWAIAEDNSGNIWIGGHSEGLSILPAKEKNNLTPEFINFKHSEEIANSLSNNTVNVIFQDHFGTIWIGTASGLNKVKIKDNNFKDINSNSKIEFFAYHHKNGLPGEGISGILEDNNGNLWLSTSNGLSKFNIKKESYINYDESDGLQGNEFGHNAYFKDQNGRMYFGGPNGINAFYPDSIKPNPFLPKVVITDFKIFNKSVQIGEKINGDLILQKSINYTSEIILSHKNNIFTIEFAALHYSRPEKNRYAYIMEGFEQNWNYIGNKRDATYTNLDPGRYIFRVKASNNDGIWNKEGVSIRIVILPPWWKTWWFRLFAILLFISLLVGFYRSRVRILKSKKLHLEKLVLERTKEINEKNKILLKQTNELNETNTLLEEKNQYIEEQNELLFDKTEKLNETNTLLEERQQIIEEQSEELQTTADELLENNETLSTLNATKDKFFTIIAHDLKNPFNAILGFSEILLARYDKFDDEKRKKLISSVFDSSTKIYKLLENLLQWARSQTGSIEFKPEEFNLSEIVDSNILLVDNLLKDKNLQISNHCTEDLKVYADKNMVNTVVRNLITNAIKFSENGTISIECEQDNSVATLKIIDNGIGIEQEKLKDLFNITSSKSTNGTRGESGTGLGLILCKEFIEKNNGAIGVESKVGKGSAFSFTLPVRQL